jgi:hypothetical protein
MEIPALSFALPLQSETHWSDMLAVLIATDPVPLGAVLGRRYGLASLLVGREALVDSANRPDIVLTAGGARIAVIEVKVLADLGPQQLERYRRAVPDADAYVLVHPERLAVPLHDAGPWQAVTWETLLRAYEDSDHSWAAATARAWRRHLDSALPEIGPGTRWNDLRPGEDFVIAMRARMPWLYGQIQAPAGVGHDLVGSSAGVSWVARLYSETPVPGYWIMTEVEENLPVRDYPKYFAPDGTQPLGPSARVCLYQWDVDTSAGFDWDYLHRLWPLMERARTDWVRHAARPRAAHDRDGCRRIVAAGAPAFLRIGFGDAQAKINKSCMFGARTQFPAASKLAKISSEVAALAELTLQLAQDGSCFPKEAGDPRRWSRVPANDLSSLLKP